MTSTVSYSGSKTKWQLTLAVGGFYKGHFVAGCEQKGAYAKDSVFLGEPNKMV